MSETREQQDQKLQSIGKNTMSCLRDMVAALECDYDRLEELKNERDGWDKEDHDTVAWEDSCPDEVVELNELEEAAGDCESREDAEQRIMEDPLSLEYRSDWCSSKEDLSDPAEYCLLLSTGGPATRIIGELRNGQATSARLEVQDWFTPWTEYITTGDDHDALLTYVNCFCFE